MAPVRPGLAALYILASIYGVRRVTFLLLGLCRNIPGPSAPAGASFLPVVPLASTGGCDMTGHREQYVEPITIDGILDWLERTVSALVDFPGCVRVQAMKGAQTTIFEVKVDPGDVRRIIGRKGRTASALRELLTNFGARIKMRCHLEILEPSHTVDEIPTLSAEDDD